MSDPSFRIAGKQKEHFQIRVHAAGIKLLLCFTGNIHTVRYCVQQCSGFLNDRTTAEPDLTRTVILQS